MVYLFELSKYVISETTKLHIRKKNETKRGEMVENVVD